MKITKIEYQNFRNYKEKGCITFPTDGTVSIIYGPNGVGKTTLHNLFQWVFYGRVTFDEADGKEIAIAVVVEDSGYGSKYAVPIAKKVFDLYFE